jgi:hypothetical protein
MLVIILIVVVLILLIGANNVKHGVGVGCLASIILVLLLIFGVIGGEVWGQLSNGKWKEALQAVGAGVFFLLFVGWLFRR